MKKISAVLLILALVGGAVFASFTGSAGVSFGFNLDSKDYGFKNTTGVEAEVSIFERLVDKAGKGDIYAEIKAELALSFVIDDDYDWTDYDTFLDLTAKVTSAKIIGDGWFVGILGAAGAPNFAASAIDFNAADEALDLAFVAPGAGVTVGVADYTFGLAVPYTLNNIENKTYNVFLSAVTPAYEFADGLTGKFGVAGLLADTAMGGFASLEVGYKQDDLTVTLASDLSFAKDADFGVEVAVAAEYDFVNADVYYALKDYDGTVYGGADHILSVQVGAEIEGFDVTVYGKDLVNTQDLGASVAYAVTDELKVGVNGGYVIATEAWRAGAEATYTAEMFTAKVAGSYNSADQLKLSASVSSDKLVDGATLALSYAGDDLLDKVATAATKVGAITASATITF